VNIVDSNSHWLFLLPSF